MQPKVIVKRDTIFKRAPVQSEVLPPDQKVAIAEGGEYPLGWFKDQGSHLLVSLATPINGIHNWYLFEGHIELLQEEDHPIPSDEYEEPAQQPQLIQIPGRKISLSEAIIPGGSFTWAEATKNGTRLPQSEAIASEIIKMATELQWVRKFLGDRRIRINSWYRPPDVNRQVGGVPNSRHLRGDGVDITVDGLTPSQVQGKLRGQWSGGLGLGRTFTHLDTRPYRAVFGY